MATWEQVTIQPSDAAIGALRAAWRWQLGEHWQPVLFSALGDVFFEVPAGSIWWLSTATAALEHVADSRADFAEQLGTDATDEWFLPGLVDVLRAQGKELGPDGCYTFAILPIFAEGSFSAENMHPTAAATHFAESGRLHERIRKLPEGTQIQITLPD
jgi:hypothetical protein